MAGSGVYRKRNSAKNHPMPIMDNPQRKGRYTGAPKRGEDLKAPKKSSEQVFKRYQITPPPMGNESPSRGEGPQRNVRSK